MLQVVRSAVRHAKFGQARQEVDVLFRSKDLK